jgi:Protein of unknown function (DUF3181)
MHPSEIVEKLAAEIGEAVYMDIAKWHLYLRDAHMHTALAEQLLPLLSEGSLDEKAVVEILAAITVPLGGGKREVPLTDLLPMQCQSSLMGLLKDFQHNNF